MNQIKNTRIPKTFYILGGYHLIAQQQIPIIVHTDSHPITVYALSLIHI